MLFFIALMDIGTQLMDTRINVQFDRARPQGCLDLKAPVYDLYWLHYRL